jgi:hypothetical protein
MTSHAAIVWARISRGRRALIGAVLLGTFALIGIFAELFAAPAPIVAFGPHGALFPAILNAAAYEGLSRGEIEAMHEGDVAVWPIVRYGPSAPTEAGPFAP